jgi:hypothetical protein
MRRYYPHVLLFILVLIFVMLWLRNWNEESAANQVGKTVIAQPAKEIRNVPKVAVEVKQPVKVYKGGAALKGGLKLPRVAVEDQAIEVLASSKIDGRDDHPKIVTTVLNVETGESETYVRTDPLPWFAMSSRGGVGMYAGIKNGEPAVRLQARQELFSVKALRFEGIATVDQPISGPVGTDYFVGLGAEYRW